MEILAPAGNKQNLIQAVSSGADAVYLGYTSFSARSSADNFDFNELKYCVAYAKTFGVKVYLTVNTIIKNSELNDFFSLIKSAYEIGVDAFILQDIFLGKYLKDKIPNINLHLSTQAGVCNVYGAELAKNYGFSRVILARETTLEDIKAICKIIETEVFIQGALCTSFSGHCYFSSFIGGNSGNRGACKQPCRKLYSYISNGEPIKKGFNLSLSDLCVGEKINLLKELGVTSFKIEGRMRSEEYVAVAVQYYKSLLQGKNRVDLFKALKSVYNRGDYTEGLAFNQKADFISDKIQSHKGLKVGVIGKVFGDKFTFKDYYNYEEGDSFKIIRNGREIGNAICETEKGKLVLKFKGNVLPGDEVNITKDVSVINKYLQKPNKIDIFVDVEAVVGKKLKLSCMGVTVESESVLETAKSRPVTKEDILSNLRKVDVYPFNVTANVNIDGEPFIVNSVLNGLRSKLYSEIFYGKYRKICDTTLNYTNNSITNNTTENKCAIIINEFVSIPKFVTDVIYCPTNYSNVDGVNELLKVEEKVWLYIPPFASQNDLKIIDKIVDKFYGIYADGYWAIEYAKQKGLKLFAGVGFNLFNNIDVDILNIEGVEEIALSKEIKGSELVDFNKNTFCLQRGSLEIMDLIYCPFSKDCKNCRVNNEFILQDTDKREFKVLRYKLDGCRFKVFNCNILTYDIDNFNKLYDLRTLNYYESNAIIKTESLSDLKNQIKNHTNGNYVKGTI